MKIALYICVNGREEIVPIIQENLIKLIDSSPYTVDLIINATTKRDVELWEDISDHIQVCNLTPLGWKFNEGIPWMIGHGYDYMMQCGQDDIISPDYWEYAKTRIEENCPIFGCHKLQVMDWETKESFIYVCPTVFGAGRMIRMDLILATYRKKGYIWKYDISRGLDFNSEHNILSTCELYQKGVTRARLLNEPYPLVTDIKTKDNINSFAHLKKFADADIPKGKKK